MNHTTVLAAAHSGGGITGATVVMLMLTAGILVSVMAKKTKVWEILLIGSWAGLICLQTSVGPSLQSAMGSLGSFLGSVGHS